MRIGIDLGGTKIAIVALDETGSRLFEKRVPTPRNDYHGTISALCHLVEAAESFTALQGSVGIGMPGSLSPRTGLVQNANSTWLNDKPFGSDLEAALGRPVQLANDANCFTLSEATDGAAAQYDNVFGVILGTGCGGALVRKRQLINGPRNIAGEWGHVPLPWMEREEYPGRKCWCGQSGCLETFLSGPAIALDHQAHHGEQLTAEQIHARTLEGDPNALASLARHSSRLARGLAMIINIFDPDMIVLGGGLSKMPHLYDQLPDLIAPFLFSDDRTVRISPPHHGDDSGVRGAAWLWNSDRPVSRTG